MAREKKLNLRQGYKLLEKLCISFYYQSSFSYNLPDLLNKKGQNANFAIDISGNVAPPKYISGVDRALYEMIFEYRNRVYRVRICPQCDKNIQKIVWTRKFRKQLCQDLAYLAQVQWGYGQIDKLKALLTWIREEENALVRENVFMSVTEKIKRHKKEILEDPEKLQELKKFSQRLDYQYSNHK